MLTCFSVKIMGTVQITSQINIGLEQLVSSISQLETVELEQFVEQINLLLATRKISNLPQRETELLEQISQGLPEEIQHRYDELQLKLHNETIGAEEHEELLSLIDTVERSSVNRLKHLVELSQLRRVSLDELMSQLGIHHPPVYA
jgi:preprotein translocase subunit SecA